MEKSPKINEPIGDFQEINSTPKLDLQAGKKSWKRINGVYLVKSRILKLRHCEKAKNFEKISYLFWRLLTCTLKIRIILQNNFTQGTIQILRNQKGGWVRCLRNQKTTEKIIFRIIFINFCIWGCSDLWGQHGIMQPGVSTLSPWTISRQNVSLEWRPI